MPRVMFPFSDEELRRRAREEKTEQRRQQAWRRPQGFFKHGYYAIRDAAITKHSRSYLYRVWLETFLTKPTLARDVIAKAKREGLSEWGVRRAKKRLGIESVRLGGRGTGKRNPWLWKPPSVAN